MSKRFGIKNHTKKLIYSFRYAFQGVFSFFKSERNMKIHIFIMTFVIIFGILLKISKFEWFVCIILLG